jgi:hypothetical protein
MPRGFSRTLRLSFTLPILCALGWTALDAQSGPPGWTVSGGLAAIRVGDREGWGYGPEVGVRRDFGRNWGVGLRLALPALGSDTGAAGAAIDLGPTLTHVTPRMELGLSAGATGFLVGDHADLVDGGLGLFAGGHATVWLTLQLGVMAGADVRSTSGLTGYPSVSAGLAMRF